MEHTTPDKVNGKLRVIDPIAPLPLGLSEKARTAIELIANGISYRFMDQLVMARLDLEKVNSGTEEDKNKVLRSVIERGPLYELGIHKNLIIHVQPGYLDHADRDIVPYKLVTLPDSGGAVSREARKEFIAELERAVIELIKKDVVSAGPTIVEIMARQQRLHKERHRMHPSENVCPFRLLDEDFIMTLGATDNEIVKFGWICSDCEFHHNMKVFCRRIK